MRSTRRKLTAWAWGYPFAVRFCRAARWAHLVSQSLPWRDHSVHVACRRRWTRSCVVGCRDSAAADCEEERTIDCPRDRFWITCASSEEEKHRSRKGTQSLATAAGVRVRRHETFAGGSAKTHSRNVVRRLLRIARQQRRYACGPKSRTMTAVCRRTSFVVMTPRMSTTYNHAWAVPNTRSSGGENGAPLIVLWNAMILHARWGGYV